MPGARATGQPGGVVDVGLGVGGADSGEGHARGLGQVGQPVGARLGVLSRIGEQQPDLLVGPLPALGRVGERGEQRVLGHDACRHFGDSRAMPEEMT